MEIRVVPQSWGQDEVRWAVWARVGRCPQGHAPSGDCVSALALAPASVHLFIQPWPWPSGWIWLKLQFWGWASVLVLEAVTECLQIDSEMLRKVAQQGKREDKQWVLSDSVKSIVLSCHLSYSPKDSSKSSGEKYRHTREIHPIQKEALKYNSDK